MVGEWLRGSFETSTATMWPLFRFAKKPPAPGSKAAEDSLAPNTYENIDTFVHVETSRC